MLTVRHIADRLIGLSAFFGAVGLIVEVLVILADVVGRYFHAPLKGAQDVSQMGMVIIVFGGMALCDKMGGHVSVDVLENRYPAWLNRFVNILGALLGAIVFAGIAWTMYESSKLSTMLNLRTNIIGLPKVYFQWAVVALSLITAFGMALRALEMTLGRSAPEADQPLLSEQ